MVCVEHKKVKADPSGLPLETLSAKWPYFFFELNAHCTNSGENPSGTVFQHA
jgi:hypothetical protein